MEQTELEERSSDSVTSCVQSEIQAGEILLLDDDSTVLNLLGGVLTAAGYRCHTATKPKMALSLARERAAIRVVLSDVYMPEMTGLEFVEGLNSLRLARAAPRVLLLTAKPSLELAVDALRRGVCDFLLKPLRPSDLIKAVRRAMDPAELRAGRNEPQVAELTRLSLQAEELAERLRGLAQTHAPSAGDSTARVFGGAQMTVLEAIEVLRRLQTRYIEHHLDDVAWDLLLELARAEQRSMCLAVSDLMITNGSVSSTTLLRRINKLESGGYISKTPDPNDARRDFVCLSARGRALVTSFLEQAQEHIWGGSLRSENRAITSVHQD